MYDIEREIRKRDLKGENKRLHRLTHSKPLVDSIASSSSTGYCRATR